MIHLRACYLLLCLVGVWGVAGADRTAPEEVVSVTLEEGASLRTLAERYLRDPDAWPEILHASQLSSLDQARPGMTLRIPVGIGLRLSTALGELRQRIYRATAAGALIFAREPIDQAMRLQAEALAARRDAALSQASVLAQQGLAAAADALELSLASRDAEAEAILDSARGRVERKRSAELDWSGIDVDTLLRERERLRTLSESSAVVRFRDASAIHMGELSNLAIQRLREDRLTRREEVNVLLYGGDVRALMGSDAGRQKLSIAAEGVEAQGDSRHYWVQKTPEVTRVSNFEGELAITAEGSTVRVGPSQGTLVEADKPPAQPIDLLEPPELGAPAEGGEVYKLGVELAWTEVPGAESYWVEVGRDPELTDLVMTRTDIGAPSFDLTLPAEGLYFWRVSAVDDAGLPGAPAPARHFLVTHDATPPYLVLRSPAPGQAIRGDELEVVGQTEAAAVARIDGASVEVGSDGHFRQRVRLLPGQRSIRVEAWDPAGNRYVLERAVQRISGEELELTFAPQTPRDDAGRLLAAQPWLAVSGSAPPGTAVTVSAADTASFASTAVADPQERFSLTLPAGREARDFRLSARGPRGQRRSLDFAVVLDETPPVIHLDHQVPARSANSVLRLMGRVDGGSSLEVERQTVDLDAEGRFALQLTLQPGENRISAVARDAVGNEARWQQSVILDQEPPRLAGYRLSEAGDDDHRVLLLEIEARDDSGLVAGIPYLLKLGEVVRRGIARRCADRHCHWDRVALPARQTSAARLTSVTLQDYLGNRREIPLD